MMADLMPPEQALRMSRRIKAKQLRRRLEWKRNRILLKRRFQRDLKKLRGWMQ